MPELITLNGRLERITFSNPANHYTVARLRTDGQQGLVTVVGVMPGAVAGERVLIKGRWQSHPRFGEQLAVQYYEVTLPDSVAGIRRYLASGVIKGLGAKTVDRLVDHFGGQTFDVLKEAPGRLTEVSGVGVKTAQRITSAWRRHHGLTSVMQILTTHGLPASHASHLFELYGEAAADILAETPYQLAVDWPGVGFTIADPIALAGGRDPDDGERTQACISHVLARHAQEGHTYSPAPRLARDCRQRHKVSPQSVADHLQEMAASGDLVLETPDSALGSQADPAAGCDPEGREESFRVYARDMHRAESAIARRLFLLDSLPPATHGLDSAALAQAVVNKQVIQLSPEQQDILEQILDHRVAVVTGGPGTGKTTLIRAITAVFESLGLTVALAAPTGRAAKRLAEVSRRKAQTLHRLLGFRPDEEIFTQNRDNPLAADAVIVDEASMLDTLLTRYLAEAVPVGSRLILVGDVDQLPAIGPGNVLADLIAAAILPTFQLRQIFRQAQESPLIHTAHRVRTGELPELDSPATVREKGGLLFFEEQDPETMAAMITRLCTHQMPRQFELHARRDIQVLCPMHKGPVGTLNLNSILQKALNADGPQQASAPGRFRTHDKVMQLRNNYQKDVYNGEIGTVLPPREGTSEITDGEDLLVDFDGRPVGYKAEELDQLTLAYAISVHKSQGSEYPAVVIPLTTQHYPLLQRNLIYTALTRAQRLVVLVGMPKALKIALANDHPNRRLTGLADRLKELG